MPVNKALFWSGKQPVSKLSHGANTVPQRAGLQYERLFAIFFCYQRRKKMDGNFRNEKSFHSFVADFMITEANTKVRIRDKAKELFLRYGIRSVSMDDIANQLGMSKKTIYQYYTDKNELVDAVVEDDVQGLQGDCM